MRTKKAPRLAINNVSGYSLEYRKVLYLNPEEYPGGIGAWGALDPVFDTTGIVPEKGVHIHARKVVDGEKSIDETFDLVRVPISRLDGSKEIFEIHGEDATNYNISAIFKFQMTCLRCPECDKPHSDQGYYAVHPHYVHKCRCGHVFESEIPCISNPVILLKELCDDMLQDRPLNDPLRRKLINKQVRKWHGAKLVVRYQIWGSNPAILWTSPKLEEGGVHVHMFLSKPLSPCEEPKVDQTYGIVKIDGINLDPEQIRYLMAQQGLDYLYPSVQSLTCPSCSNLHFDRLDSAVNPHTEHACEHCGFRFPSPDATPVVSNPAYAAVQQLHQNWKDIC